MSSYLTSNSLITSVKNRALIPTNQQTFSTDDFLRFANEEMYNGLVPLMIQVHEEFLLKQEVTPLDGTRTAFDIPYRAVGSKLRDISILDGNQNYYSLTRISPDALDNFPGPGSATSSTGGFYLLDNTVNLLSNSYPLTTGSKLVFTFYMRPNSLVREDRVSTIQAVNKTSARNFNASGVNTATDQLTIVNHNLTTGVSVVASGSSLPQPLAANGKYWVNVIDSSTLELFTDAALTSKVNFTTQSGGSLLPNCYDIVFTGNSSVFNSSSQFDITQFRSPHKISHYDLTPVFVGPNFIRVREESLYYPIPNNNGTPRLELPRRNDIVSLAGETIIPQIPDELHPILAQRVACRCLEALGDREGLGAANAKLAEMISLAMPLINDRTEGNPQKVVNYNSPLRGRILGNRSWRP
jgi:hypothetical protein